MSFKFYTGLAVTHFPVENLHVTTMFSDLVPTPRMNLDSNASGTAFVKSVEYWEDANVTVLVLGGAEIAYEHNEYYTSLGFTYEYEYKPHATVARGCKVEEFKHLIGETMILTDAYVRILFY